LAAGWLHRQQGATTEYLKAENRLLRERLDGRRIVFTDAERRRLAETARAAGARRCTSLEPSLRRTLWFAGTGNWSLGSGRSSKGDDRVDPARAKRSRRSWYAGPRRTGAGAIRGSREQRPTSVIGWDEGGFEAF